MLIAIIILLFVLIGFAFKILKFNVLFKLQIDSEKKCIIVQFSFYKIKIISYEFDIRINEKRHFQIKYYKKGRLEDIYSPKDILGKIKKFASEIKKDFDLVGHEVYITFDKFFDKKNLAIENLSLLIDLGTEDAAATALLHGVLTAAISALLVRLYDPNRKPEIMSVNIKPYFQKTMFKAFLTCIVSVRLSSATAIGAGLLLLFFRNKSRKENTFNASERKK